MKSQDTWVLIPALYLQGFLLVRFVSCSFTRINHLSSLGFDFSICKMRQGPDDFHTLSDANILPSCSHVEWWAPFW